jgi:hypothetical protein
MHNPPGSVTAVAAGGSSVSPNTPGFLAEFGDGIGHDNGGWADAQFTGCDS